MQPLFFKKTFYRSVLVPFSFRSRYRRADRYSARLFEMFSRLLRAMDQ